jgi:pyruvate/2-oxoglutarate dehydrogenase complex dihydrolipoamide acyltransferase (E2) component
LSLFFTEIDGQAVVVYVNGKQVASLGKEASRKPFEVDVTDAVTAGRNPVALKVDHRRITELFLGGIVRPVLLIEKPQAQ